MDQAPSLRRRRARLIVAGRQVQAAAAHDLVRPEQVTDRREAAPHVHQPAEREQQEDRHAEHEVELVRPRQRDQRLGVDRRAT